ncbi:hypothetical protein [Oerskovia flava]|uniref:hypothetical protein n=1 Tax=Oerskovia flava TaxID=2986422 RepID=UPI00223ECBA8|nr:hypothetical protein [Oerskovia sp. JB1-3-2]
MPLPRLPVPRLPLPRLSVLRLRAPRVSLTDDLVADWVARALEVYPRPTYPLTAEWDASVAGLVRQVPYVPRVATRPLDLLDRFGSVHAGPTKVGLDGDEVEWERVVEIRTQPAWASLSADALEANLAQYLGVLPPLPGRSWVLRKISELVVSLYLAVVPVPDELVDLIAEPSTDVGQDDRPSLLDRVVSEIVYRRRFGQGEATASTTAVLLQLAFPGAADAICRTAVDRGVPVVHVPADESEIGVIVARAATWRATALGLRETALGLRPRLPLP